jgi:hypothetical protein
LLVLPEKDPKIGGFFHKGQREKYFFEVVGKGFPIIETMQKTVNIKENILVGNTQTIADMGLVKNKARYGIMADIVVFYLFK